VRLLSQHPGALLMQEPLRVLPSPEHFLCLTTQWEKMGDWTAKDQLFASIQDFFEKSDDL
jgi:hypothetical protein